MARRRGKKPTTYRYQRVLYQGKSLSSSPRVWWSVGGLVVGVFVLNLVIGDGGILRGMELRAEIREAQRMGAELERDLARLDREIAVRRTDPSSYEKPAREKFGMSGEGEWVFQFHDDMRVPPGPWDAELGVAEATAGVAEN